jgi:multidrug efflux pump subunit AcrA (membrane-fusion protein)
MQIVDPSSMIVNATVNQTDVERLRIGQKARVRFDAFPDLELPARVYAIGTVAKSSRFRADWVKEMAVALKLEKMDPRVIPDLSVSADVILQSEEAPAVIPREAITQNPQGQPYVWARVGSRWERRPIELGVMNNTMAAVRTGLREGEVIALEPPPASQGNQRGES